MAFIIERRKQCPSFAAARLVNGPLTEVMTTFTEIPPNTMARPQPAEERVVYGNVSTATVTVGHQLQRRHMRHRPHRPADASFSLSMTTMAMRRAPAAAGVAYHWLPISADAVATAMTVTRAADVIATTIMTILCWHHKEIEELHWRTTVV
jgi:hypothetical protein